MNPNRIIEGLAVLALVAAAAIPFSVSHAHDNNKKYDGKWTKELAETIEASVRAGLARGAVGMEKGADKMLRGADKMEAYADRLERDPEFREAEAAKKTKWRDNGRALTADEILERLPELRSGAEELREGAEDMRKAAEKMRRGDAS